MREMIYQANRGWDRVEPDRRFLLFTATVVSIFAVGAIGQLLFGFLFLFFPLSVFLVAVLLRIPYIEGWGKAHQIKD